MNKQEASTDSGYFTLGEIAALLRVTTHRVKYAVEQYGIAPTMRVGILRCWVEKDLPRIESALKRIAANRGGPPWI